MFERLLKIINGKIKRKNISTRYDKLAVCFENFVLLAAFVIHF